MQRSEKFEQVFFPETVLREAVAMLPKRSNASFHSWSGAHITAGPVSWGFDNETEFFAEYSPSVDSATVFVTVGQPDTSAVDASIRVSYHAYNKTTTVEVHGDSRADLLAPFTPFRNSAAQYRLPDPPRPATPPQPPLKIFIGHGGSKDWRDLKDALQDHHGYAVETFETKPRAGYTIPEVIEDMARGNALALLVLTAEDEQIDGSVRARENVVHEVGYFQGRLGSKRAILIMEDGVNEFSNIHGIVHLPYKNIREVEGQVLAIIKREFPHLSK